MGDQPTEDEGRQLPGGWGPSPMQAVYRLYRDLSPADRFRALYMQERPDYSEESHEPAGD